jgi:hypothetical protein
MTPCPAFAALLLCLAACDSGDRSAPAAENAAEPADREEAANAAGGGGLLPPCPFENTERWAGSVEGGRLLVTGNVDLQMAGFRPALSERPEAAPGTIALDLALTPEPNAAVTDLARYERRGAPAYRRGEIWCGGERIADFDIVVVAD